MIISLIVLHPLSREQLQTLIQTEKGARGRTSVLRVLGIQMRKAEWEKVKRETLESNHSCDHVSGGPGREISKEKRKRIAEAWTLNRKRSRAPGESDACSPETAEPLSKKAKSSTSGVGSDNNKSQQETEENNDDIPVNGGSTKDGEKSGVEGNGRTQILKIISDPTTTKVNPDSLIGMSIKKNFENFGVFEGHVISHDVDMSGSVIYRIRYRDGDEEDLFLSELTSFLE